MEKDLILIFREESLKHGLAIEKGNSKVANKAYDNIHMCYLEIKNEGVCETRCSKIFTRNYYRQI